MTTNALNDVLARMATDADFAAQVRANPDEAARGLNLDDSDLAMLLSLTDDVDRSSGPAVLRARQSKSSLFFGGHGLGHSDAHVALHHDTIADAVHPVDATHTENADVSPTSASADPFVGATLSTGSLLGGAHETPGSAPDIHQAAVEGTVPTSNGDAGAIMYPPTMHGGGGTATASTPDIHGNAAVGPDGEPLRPLVVPPSGSNDTSDQQSAEPTNENVQPHDSGGEDGAGGPGTTWITVPGADDHTVTPVEIGAGAPDAGSGPYDPGAPDGTGPTDAGTVVIEGGGIEHTSTETMLSPDGTKDVVTGNSDGTLTTSTVNPDGSTIVTTSSSDGDFTSVETSPDGQQTVTVVDHSGISSTDGGKGDGDKGDDGKGDTGGSGDTGGTGDTGGKGDDGGGKGDDGGGKGDGGDSSPNPDGGATDGNSGPSLHTGSSADPTSHGSDGNGVEGAAPSVPAGPGSTGTGAGTAGGDGAQEGSPSSFHLTPGTGHVSSNDTGAGRASVGAVDPVPEN